MEELMRLLTLQLENGGSAGLTVTGYSMMPMLYDRRDSVTLVPINGREKKGDIVLYKRENGAYVLHRIIGEDRDGFVCCGDNQYMKEPVSRHQLIARVTSFVRKGKEASVEKMSYKWYVAIWVGLFCFRGMYIPVRRFFGKLTRKITGK
jgi:hypothetical protein